MTAISNNSVSSMLNQQMQQARQDMFKKADADDSGGLTLEEFSAAGPTDADGNKIDPPAGAASVEEMFASLDTDGDGILSQSEMEAGKPEQPDGSKAGFSQNNLMSGEMMTELFSSFESEEEVEAFFTAADSDGDGTLTEEELTAAVESMMQETAPSGPPPSGPPPSGPPPSESSDEDTNATYDAMDTNEDGTVSLEELLAAAKEAEEESQTSSSALINNFTNALLALQEELEAA